MLARVRKTCVKSVLTSSGRYVQQMEPSCLQQAVPTSDATKSSRSLPRTITWFCLPYFSLEQYSGLESADQPSFPIQTLLQTQYSQVDRARDMQQIVRQRKGTLPGNMCFHVSQLWCLVVDNSNVNPTDVKSIPADIAARSLAYM